MSLLPINIKATTLPDAFFQAVYNILKQGRRFKIDSGSFAGQERLEYDYITIHILNPGWPVDRRSEDELLPHIPEQYNIPDPVQPGYLAEYLPYLMIGEKKEGEAYTYGERLNCYKLPALWLDQVGVVIEYYKRHGHRTNQMVLQIAEPGDILLKDPPCLRQIFTRIQDGKLHFHVYFRSNDLWSGFPANLAAIQILKEYMAGEIGVGDGEIIYSCSGLHLYDYSITLAETLRGKTVAEFKGE